MDGSYLSLEERWKLDIEAAKEGGGMIASTPQCEICQYWIKGNAMQCKKYIKRKPNDTLKCKKECPEFMASSILQLCPQNLIENQLLGGIFGFCVGDALGVPVEFSSREERLKDPVKEIRAYGTYHQYFGTWSDDSTMTFCLMESLKDGYSLEDIADKFCKFYDQAYWTPHHKVFDIGNTTVNAIKKMKQNISPINCGGKDEEDNGNGSLMRVLPLAFFLKEKPIEERVKMIEDISSLTHAHKRSKLACIIYIELAINLIKGQTKREAYKRIQEIIVCNCKDEYEEEFENFDRILNNDLSLLKEDEIKSSGYVVDSLEAAIWSFLSSNSYAETILKAINLGGDTDTIAAIAGGLAGIFYGINSIPDKWVQCLARKNDIYQLCIDFSKKNKTSQI